MQMLFSWGLTSKYLVTILTSISLEDCTDECASRSTCGLLLYDRRSKVCELHTDEAAATDNIVRVPGSVIVTGIEHDKMCTADCVEDISAIRECQHPERTNYELLKGDIFSVGDTVSVHLHLLSNMYHITCSDSGVWRLDPEPEYCPDCHDCTDIALRGHTESGVFFVNSTFHFFCAFEPQGQAWLIFQRRQDGSVDFFNDWETYVKGFGNIETEFWFGLGPLHRIISQYPGQYQLRVDMQTFSGDRFFATYSTFDLADGRDNYRLTVGGYDGTAGDSLSLHNGMQFTTFDKDNDLVNSYNCARKFFGAWWYKTCHASNLNGRYDNSGGQTPYGENIIWYEVTTHERSLEWTEMKIRRLP